MYVFFEVIRANLPLWALLLFLECRVRRNNDFEMNVGTYTRKKKKKWSALYRSSYTYYYFKKNTQTHRINQETLYFEASYIWDSTSLIEVCHKPPRRARLFMNKNFRSTLRQNWNIWYRYTRMCKCVKYTNTYFDAHTWIITSDLLPK